MILLPLLLLPLFGWLADGQPGYVAAGGWVAYGAGCVWWLGVCRRYAKRAG